MLQAQPHAELSTPEVYGFLRDGSRKEMTLTPTGIHYKWRGSLLAAKPPAPGGIEMPWGYSCTYPQIQRVWIKRRRLYVETAHCAHWVRFRRRDAAEAERCRGYIADRIPPPGEIEVTRSQIETCPEDYHGLRIRLTGWVQREFEGSFLIWDPEEYAAHRLDPRGGAIACDYEVRGFNGSIIQSGRRVVPRRNRAFQRVWVSVRAAREFLEVAGGSAKEQASVHPRKAPRDLGDIWWDWVCCVRAIRDPDEAISLRGLEGVFGPMTLCGIFESLPGRGYGHMEWCEALLTAYRVSRPEASDGAVSPRCP